MVEYKSQLAGLLHSLVSLHNLLSEMGGADSSATPAAFSGPLAVDGPSDFSLFLHPLQLALHHIVTLA